MDKELIDFQSYFLHMKDEIENNKIKYYFDYRIKSCDSEVKYTSFHFDKIDDSNINFVKNILYNFIKESNYIKKDEIKEKIINIIKSVEKTYWMAIWFDIDTKTIRIYIWIKWLNTENINKLVYELTNQNKNCYNEETLIPSIFAVTLDDTIKYRIYWNYIDKNNKDISYPLNFEEKHVDLVMKIYDSSIKRDKFCYFVNDKNINDYILKQFIKWINKTFPNTSIQNIKINTYAIDNKNISIIYFIIL